MSQRFIGHVRLPLERVHIELTNVCDFNCTFCAKSEMTRPYGYMEKDLAKRIITEMGRRQICEKVTFHVMGEPTLHPDLFEILDHAVARGVNVGLTTNGRNLGGEIGRRLQEYNLWQVDVSVQTPDAGSFRLRNAGKLTFDEYVSGVLRFFSEYMSRGHDSTFKFRFLNTCFRKKGLEEKKGEVRVISTTKQLRDTFKLWGSKIYDITGVEGERRERALKKIGKLTSYRWNVVEVYPKVFFETYVLIDWGHAFDGAEIRDAWAGYCFGMRDHFAILYNGDVTLCCIDYDGRTAVGNLKEQSLEAILSSDRVGEIVRGFKHFRLVHPYCRKCLGSRSFVSWLTKPVMSIAALKLLKPFFYTHTSIPIE